MIPLFLDFIFPPLCLSCSERCSTKFFCPTCWELCAPPDPLERCRHCFGEISQLGEVCGQCRKGPLLPIERAYVFEAGAPIWRFRKEEPSAIASFAVNQWIRLEWPVPDAIIPMPDPISESITKAFASLLECPLVKALRSEGPRFELKEGLIKEDLQLLLMNGSNSVESLRAAASALTEAFPKRTYLLSLIPYDHFNS
ncbi:MAG: hypothetical protein V4487_03790 [Chlamydiota bacterium]